MSIPVSAAPHPGDVEGRTGLWQAVPYALCVSLFLSLPPRPDLVSQSIDVVLNQRSCMLVVLRIIEENIPEVRTGEASPEGALPVGLPRRLSLFLQLQSLNLSSNKLYRLDDLSELAQKAAGLKILDLSRNEVGAAPDPLRTPPLRALTAPLPSPAAAEVGTGAGQSEGAQAGRALAGRQPAVRHFPGPVYLRQVSVSLGAALGAHGPPLLCGGQNGRMKRGRPPPVPSACRCPDPPPQGFPTAPGRGAGP